MGQTTSKPGEFVIPMKKNFKLSYLIYEQINEIPEVKEEIDLRILVENYSDLLEGFIFHKCKQIGYTLVSPKLNVISIRIDTILNDIKHKGIHVSNTSFNELLIKSDSVPLIPMLVVLFPHKLVVLLESLFLFIFKP